MRWKPHVRFGGRAGETHPPEDGQGAPARSHLANAALDDLNRYQAESATILRNILFVLIGIILFSAFISMPQGQTFVFPAAH